MLALEQLKKEIRDARNVSKDFSAEDFTNAPDEKLGGGAYTITEATREFEDALQSVEMLMKNPLEIKKYLSNNDISDAADAINILSRMFSIGNYSEFADNLDSHMICFHQFIVLSQEKKDNKKYEAIADMEKTLQEMNTHVADVEIIFNKIFQQNKEFEEILSANKELAEKQETALSIALREAGNIEKWNQEAAKGLDDIKNTKREAMEIRGKLTNYDKHAEIKSKELEQIIATAEGAVTTVKEALATAEQAITASEQALHLRTSEGLSAAFNAQARDLGARWAKAGWLISGAASSLIGGYLGWRSLNILSNVTPGWYIVFLRIFLIGMFFGLSTFAFRQYSKNKSLENDYAFKSVLVGSYPGISLKIHDEAQKEYASKLISEILRDPQRTRARRTTNSTSKEKK